MKWLPTAGITDLRFKIKTLTGKHELTGKKGKIMYKYDAKSLKAEEFINDEEIRETLAYADANKDNVELIDAIIAKARERKGLNHREASVLLACQIPEKIEEVYALAQQIKKDFYGNRIVLFAPLYLSNYCVNGCVYCPYHLKNKHIARKKLTQEEIVREVTALQDMGHKRLAIEAGEDPVNNPIEYILECIQTIYSIKHKNGAIRRVNVNIAATTVENYRKLKEAGIGTYILFQETYHKESYENLHPTGPKHDYAYHTCVYCPYHLKNKHIARKKLTQEEIVREVTALQDMGHKRLAIEAGEDPVNNPIEYILECIQTIYSIKHKNGAIRRVNVNIAATTVENYRKLKEAGIGTYILFQETYHKESYENLHPTGPKHDYAYHTEAMDRAMEGGIDDVGLGVLFGLEMYRYEFAGLLMHAEHLEAVHGVGPHTISVPRVKHADDIDPTAFDNGISDDIFAKICALIRISVPYTGMIISTRESQAVREKVLPLGVSQISGASRTSVGGYAEPEPEEENSEQFDVSDQRTLDEVVNWLMKMGYIPSFCTACYREGRTGDRFMALCKNMQILNCCHPNALMTLKEYLEDYAGEETKKIGMELIDRELEKIPNPKVKQTAYEHIHDIAEGKRDFRF
ncbi:MAG: [FeFe] hydrogenase H-cluster radical SAM maturase HydG [Roseburia hominis]